MLFRSAVANNSVGASYIGSTTIVTLGTITTGIWNGTTIDVQRGGTGLTSLVAGSILYASAANTLSALSANSTGTRNFLRQVSSTAPAWDTLQAGDIPDLSGTYSAKAGNTSLATTGTITTGTWNATAIGPTYGGTGLTTFSTGDTLYASASNTLSALAANSTDRRAHV